MRLFVFDVDGTLVSDFSTELNKELINTLNEVLDRGDAIAIASGRPYSGIIQYLNQLKDGNKFCICANGALVTDIKGKILFKNPLKLKYFYQFCEEYKEILDSIDGNIYAYLFNGVGYIKYNEFIDGEYKLNGNYQPISLVENQLDDETDILKFMVASLPEHSLEIERSISQKWKNDFLMVRSSPMFIEFNNKSANKSPATAFLAKYLNIDKKNVYTFGDGGNDFLMIRDFNGVAMGNASEECKKVATFITKTAKENGVVYAIKELIK